MVARGVPVPFDEFAEPALFDPTDTDEFHGDEADEVDDVEEPEEPTAGFDYEEALGDLAELVPDLFGIWWGGSEAVWAGYAWSALTKAGLTTHDEEDEVERSLVVCRLLVLAALNREFAARAFDEGSEGGWRYEVTGMEGEYPRLDPISMGRLAERKGVWPDEVIDGRETCDQLARAFVPRLWRQVTRALLEEWGENELFVSLWISRGSDAAYPTTAEDHWDVLNTDTDPKMPAWEWLTNGMELS